MSPPAQRLETSPPDDNTLSLGQTQLRLEERNASCAVTTSSPDGKSQTYALNVPWPCHFHKNTSGKIRILESTGYHYVLVESSRPRADNPKDCETDLRSVRAKGPSVEISPHQDRVASCPPFQWDEMLFRELFN